MSDDPTDVSVVLDPRDRIYRDDHYADARLYDLEYQDYVEDLSWYAGLAEAAGDVLELGAGSGRLTLPMARTGAHVTAVDLSASMLDTLRQRADAERVDITTFEADMRSFDLGGRFPLALMAFNAVHHLYAAEDVLDCLRCVREHLTPSGKLAMDAIVPDPTFWEGDPEGHHEERTFVRSPFGRLTSWENCDYDPLTQVLNVRYHYRHEDGRVQVVPVPLRMFYPQELLGLLRIAGFRVIQCAEDFAGTPLSRTATRLVMVLERR